MAFKFINKTALIACFGFILFSACTKDNSVTLVETEEELQLQFRMVIDGAEIATEAVAAYCQNDTMEFLTISNKIEHLEFPMNTQNFEEGDFAYFTQTAEGETIWSIGGQALGEDITGLPGLLISFGDANINIESNDGQFVTGSSEGQLLTIDSAGVMSFYPYTMEFVSEIIQESTFCD